MKIIVVIVITVSWLITGCHSEPKTYEDCLLVNAEKAVSDKGAMLVHTACAKKFPTKNPFDQFDQKPSGK